MAAIQILLADAHELFREGLAKLLNATSQLQVVAQTANSSDTIQQALEVRPDLVLMDIELPESDGVMATQRIVHEWPDARIVILTDHENEDDLLAALRAGARGYLTKDVGVERLQSALLLAHAGEAIISARLASRVLKEFCGLLEERHQRRQGAEYPLTGRELEVLMLVAQGATNREIADALVISENTVKVHLRNILDKLHLRNRQQVATFAVQHGLVPDLHPVAFRQTDGSTSAAVSS